MVSQKFPMHMSVAPIATEWTHALKLDEYNDFESIPTSTISHVWKHEVVSQRHPWKSSCGGIALGTDESRVFRYGTHELYHAAGLAAVSVRQQGVTAAAVPWVRYTEVPAAQVGVMPGVRVSVEISAGFVGMVQLSARVAGRGGGVS